MIFVDIQDKVLKSYLPTTANCLLSSSYYFVVKTTVLYKDYYCFCSNSKHVFILSAPTHFTIFIRGLSSLLFSFINSSLTLSKFIQRDA